MAECGTQKRKKPQMQPGEGWTGLSTLAPGKRLGRPGGVGEGRAEDAAQIWRRSVSSFIL